MASCDGGTHTGSTVSLCCRAPLQPALPGHLAAGDMWGDCVPTRPLGPPCHRAAPAPLSPHLAGGDPVDQAEQDQAGESQEEEDIGGAGDQQHNVQSQPASPASGVWGGWGQGQTLGLPWERLRASREPWGVQPQGLLELGGCWGRGCRSMPFELMPGSNISRRPVSQSLLPHVPRMGLGPWL